MIFLTNGANAARAFATLAQNIWYLMFSCVGTPLAAALAQKSGHSIFIANAANRAALALLAVLAQNIGPQNGIHDVMKTGVAGKNKRSQLASLAPLAALAKNI